MSTLSSSSSSSSDHAARTDSLSPHPSIAPNTSSKLNFRRHRAVVVGQQILARLCEKGNITYECILASLAMSHIPCSSYLDGFRDGRLVAVLLLFRGCYFQGLFSIACINLVQFPSSFFSMRFVSVHVVHLCSSTDTTAAWKNSHLILSYSSDFHMINSISIAVHAFAWRILTSLSIGETLLPRYVNFSTNFGRPLFRVSIAPY